MKVLLVQPEYNYTRGYAETPSVALLILGTLARERGHEVKILHLEVDRVAIGEEIERFAPDVLGITVNTFQVRSARLIAKEARRVSKNVKVIVGGPHAGSWDGEADDVVVGEGESRWLDVLGEKAKFDSLDDIPIPDYGLVDLEKFCGVAPVRVGPSVAVMASRGCSFGCTFCNTPVFWGRKVRYRSPGHVLREIEALHYKHGVNEVFFQDDTFNLNHEWAKQVFEGIIEKGLNKAMSFKITSRANERLVTMEFLDLARRAGVWNIFYGVESGSQAMLDRMKKGVTVDEIKRAVRMTHEAGIETQCSFIVGLPGETWDTLRETGELINETKPTRWNWGYATPFPGTEFDAEVTARGHKVIIDFGEYAYNRLMARTDALSLNDLRGFAGLKEQGGKMAKTWGAFYGNICGSRRLLEGNIMANQPLIEEMARLVKPGDKVLEVGAGSGVMGWPLAQAGVLVTSLDNDKEVLRMAEINCRTLGANIELVYGDAFKIPFDADSFALAYTEGLLEHYSDAEIHALLAEQFRVAPIVVAAVPMKGVEGITYGNERWLTYEEWENLLGEYAAVKAFSYQGDTRLVVSMMRGGGG